MKGGWRYGAGRPGWHAKTTSARRLDVRHLQRRGYLSPGQSLSLAWGDEASIGLSVAADAVTLRYRFRADDGDWRDVNQPVALLRTPCTYGGSRPWFACPYCRRRCAILYLRGWPKCRTCARLVYPSQSEDAIGRSWGRTYRIMRRLGQGDEGSHAVPRRPKGMRRATYERLWQAWCREEEYRDAMLAAFVERRGLLL